MYIVNTPSALWIPWRVIKGFLPEHTIRKINFVKEPVAEQLFTHTPRDQIEKQFGGSRQDLVDNFWPPQLPEPNLMEANLTPHAR
jgi:hypothetical protein